MTTSTTVATTQDWRVSTDDNDSDGDGDCSINFAVQTRPAGLVAGLSGIAAHGLD
jgi:hypothetical protein